MTALATAHPLRHSTPRRNYKLENRLAWSQHIGNKLVGGCWCCHKNISYDNFCTNTSDDWSQKRPMCKRCKKLSVLDCSLTSMVKITYSEHCNTLYTLFLFLFLCTAIAACALQGDSQLLEDLVDTKYHWLFSWFTKPLLIQLAWLLYSATKRY